MGRSKFHDAGGGNWRSSTARFVLRSAGPTYYSHRDPKPIHYFISQAPIWLQLIVNKRSVSVSVFLRALTRRVDLLLLTVTLAALSLWHSGHPDWPLASSGRRPSPPKIVTFNKLSHSR